jgi:hypothetical protein
VPGTVAFINHLDHWKNCQTCAGRTQMHANSWFRSMILCSCLHFCCDSSPFKLALAKKIGGSISLFMKATIPGTHVTCLTSLQVSNPLPFHKGVGRQNMFNCAAVSKTKYDANESGDDPIKLLLWYSQLIKLSYDKFIVFRRLVGSNLPTLLSIIK